MTKLRKIIISIFFLSAFCLMMFSACTLFEPVRYPSSVEWRDDEGIFHFRSAKDGAFGCGTIVLNGEEIPASFSIGSSKPVFSIRISVESAQKLGYDYQYSINGMVYGSFVPRFIKKEQVITSTTNDVELFGVEVGKVRLKAYPVDESEFEIWEFFTTWTDSDYKFIIYNFTDMYILNKCLDVRIELPDGKTRTLTFRWLTETSGFCIYDNMNEEDYKTITDDTPSLAEGTFEYDGNNLILNFAKDELLGLQGQSLYLSEMN